MATSGGTAGHWAALTTMAQPASQPATWLHHLKLPPQGDPRRSVSEEAERASREESVNRSVVSNSAIPQTVAHQAPLSMGFSRQEYWNGLPFPSPGHRPDPRIESGSPTVQADSLSDPPGKPQLHAYFLLLLQQETHLSLAPRGAQISVGLFTTNPNVKNCKGYK